MMGNQHVQFTLLTAPVACVTLQNQIAGMEMPAIFVITAIVGSLMPDIDSPKSTMGQWVPWISKFINKKFGHRTITHDILFIMIIATLCYLKFPLTLGFWFGYVGHLFLDGFTLYGICWGWMFNHKKLKRINRIYADITDGAIHFLPFLLRVKSSETPAKILTSGLAVSLMITFYCVGGYLGNYNNILKDILIYATT